MHYDGWLMDWTVKDNMVLPHCTHKPQKGPYHICVSRSGNIWHWCRGSFARPTLESLRRKLTSCVARVFEVVYWLWLGCWSNNIVKATIFRLNIIFISAASLYNDKGSKSCYYVKYQKIFCKKGRLNHIRVYVFLGKIWVIKIN